MKRRIVFASLVAVALVISLGIAHSAGEPPKRTVFNPIINKIVDYSLPESISGFAAKGVMGYEEELSSLGREISSSPGIALGNTYYDLQHINTVGRMIGVGHDIDGSDTTNFIHYTWMDLLGPDLASGRYSAYSFADFGAGTIYGETPLFFSPGYGGYFNLVVTPDNRAVISGHYHPTGNTDDYMPTVWYDDAPHVSGFGLLSQPVDPDGWWPPPYTEFSTFIFPHVAFQIRPDGSHITHLTTTDFYGFPSVGLVYYRKEGDSSTAHDLGGETSCPSLSDLDWSCPIYYDTAWATVALVTASKSSGKVALTWTANRPDYDATPGCDTCSNNNDLGPVANIYDNDVYYQLSDDYGATWNPRVNVTQIEDDDEWRPFNDLTAMFTGDGMSEQLHIAWNSSNWDYYEANGFMGYGARIYHWAETFGPGNGNARIAATRRNEPILCNAGQYDLNLSKPQLAECNNNIYILIVDLWDGHDDLLNPDCSERGYLGDPDGSVNGELAVVISDDGGLSFDLPHNLTNSPSPQCDSDGAILECESDHWPSTTPHAYVTSSVDNTSILTQVNPRPAQAYNGGPGVEWLPVMYVNDKDPGFTLNDNSTWRNNPVRTFLMACVDPDQLGWNPELCGGWYNKIGWPTYTQPGVQLDLPRVLENTGNADLQYSLTVDEVNGPAGWLTVSGANGTIPYGIGNLDTIMIHLNTGGVIDTPMTAIGHLIFQNVSTTDVCTLFIELPITNLIGDHVWDTISTGVISLAVRNTGQFGGGTDIADHGGANLDYFNHPAECDTVDSIPGETETYIYDGSIIVGGIVGNDTIFACQIFSQGFLNDWSIYPLENSEGPTIDGILQTWNSGTMVNHDTSIAMEVTYFAPQATGSWGNIVNQWPADQQFITREFKIWSANGQAHTGLAIGEAVDWDIPADSGSDNSGESDPARRLLYCIGGEYDQDGAVECQENNDRYGGQAFGYFKKYDALISSWSIVDSLGFGGYIESSARYVYPGWKANELYVNMESAGNIYHGFVPPFPESTQIDLHSVEVYAFDYDLLPDDTLVFYSVLATVRNESEESPGPGLRIQDLADKGRKFTSYFGCCHGTKGDPNSDGIEANILDLNFMVNRIFRGGPAPTCSGEADANNDGTPGNILDLNFLVNRVFRGGPAPVSCGTPPSI